MDNKNQKRSGNRDKAKTGISVATVLSPGFLITVVCLILLAVVGLFHLGVIKSFRLNLSELTWSEQLIFFLVLFCICAAMGMGSMLFPKTGAFEDRKCNSKVTRIIIIFCLLVSSIAIFILCQALILKYGLAEFVYGSLRGYVKKDPAIDSYPFLAFSILPLISGPLCVLNWKDKSVYKTYLVWGFVIELLFALIYSSRIIVIEYFFFTAVVWLRKYHFMQRVKIKWFICAAAVILMFLVGTSAARDYESAGVSYTNNPIEWGVSRMMDYPLSAYEYSVFLLNNGGVVDPELEEIVPTVGRLIGRQPPTSNENGTSLRSFLTSNNVGAVEYTNAGGIGSIFQYRSPLFGIIFLVGYVVICVGVWGAFKKGTVMGCLLYPIIMYSIIEFWRYGVLLTEIPQLLLLSNVLVSLLITNTSSLNIKPMERVR